MEYGYEWRDRKGRRHRISMHPVGWLLLGPFLALGFLIAAILGVLIRATAWCCRAVARACAAALGRLTRAMRQRRRGAGELEPYDPEHAVAPQPGGRRGA